MRKNQPGRPPHAHHGEFRAARPTIVDMVKWLDERGIELADIRIKRPSLEEAFIELTGKSLRE